jgi:colanic acid/amylovoran biosynthesis protein
MNILLINQNSALNRGDLAIHTETLRIVKTTFPEARIAMTFHEVAPARAAFPCDTIYASLDSWAYQVDSSGKTVLTGRLRRLLYLVTLALGVLIYRIAGYTVRLFPNPAKQSLFEAFAHADLVLACGGGYIYDTVPPGGRIAELISFASWSVFLLGGNLLAVLLGKPLVLLPQSIGPLQDRVKRRVVAWLIRRARLTFVRERESLALLRELGCDQHAIYAPDMAFGMASASADAARAVLEYAGLSRIQPAFCVGMTALDWGAQSRAFEAQPAYEHALLGCIDSITAQSGVVVLIAQCHSPVAAWDDRLVHARLRARARHPDRVLLIDEILSPDLLQAIYGCMDYFIGTRMHSVILSINAGTPALAIGYLHKSRGIMREMGLNDRCYDIGAVTAEQLIAGFERLRDQPTQPLADAYVLWGRRFKQALCPLLRIIVDRSYSKRVGVWAVPVPTADGYPASPQTPTVGGVEGPVNPPHLPKL